MGNIEVFNQDSNFLITLFSLLLLLFTCFYDSRREKLFAPVWLLFAGLVIEFCANGVAVQASDIYSSGGTIGFYVFTELSLLLLAMIFMALAASQFLINNLPNYLVFAGLSVLGVICIGLFVFVIPDGTMVNKMRQIFPLAGFAYLAAGFWAQLRQNHNSGYWAAAVINSLVAVLLFLRLLEVEWAFASGLWFVPALYYTLLAFAFVMMKDNAVSEELDVCRQEIEKSNRRIDEIIRLSPFPIIISRVSDDRIIVANNNAQKLFGINPHELERYRLKDFFADSDNRQLLTDRLENEKEVQDFEVLVKTPLSDAPFWLLTSANIIDYNYDVALYSAFQDITSRKNREALLKNQAIRDPLTSLFNRRYFENEVSKLILKAKTEKDPFSVLMIDADLFKKVNDTYGHKTGDKVLIELASTAERALRDHDIVARYGGEEFVVFLPGIAAAQAAGVADRLRESISSLVVYSDEKQPVRFTVSVGVSSSEVSDNIDMLIKTADEALYRAKKNGRNRVEVFSAQDLKAFAAQGQAERKEERQSQHPVFDKENTAEISLLDGVETTKIEEGTTYVEQPVPGERK